MTFTYFFSFSIGCGEICSCKYFGGW